MTPPSILTETRDGVRLLTLNRPDVLNSVNQAMARELQAALADAAADAAVRAVLLAGAGRAFCAGQDLSEVPSADEARTADLAATVRARYNPIIGGIRSIEKPVVCAVNGVAAGAGANLALACDIIIAASDASFIQAFCRIGLIPDSGGTFFLPRLVGLQRAAGLTMLGEKLTAAQARDWGLIWEVCEPADLASRSFALAATLAAQPTRGLGLTKRALNASLANDLEAQLELEAVLQAQAGRTADFQEGVAAFREKRKPRFSGT